MATTRSSLFFNLSNKDKMLFARHMEMMTRSGMQLMPSLEVLRKQATSKNLIKLLDDIIADVKNGQFLSASLEKHHKLFGDFFINLVRVGETSGTLSENFRYLAVELEKKEELHRKIVGAMAYPLIILFATFGITGGMAFFIFPRILPVLRSLNVQLPSTTLAFIAVSDFLTHHVLALGVGIILFVIISWLLLKVQRIRFAWHKVLISLPLVGLMVKEVNLIDIGRTLSLLLKGGVLIVPALDITQKTLSNLVYQKSVQDISLAVQKGETASSLMIASPHLFPATFAQMVSVGENTGKLDETLDFLADFYETELDSTTKTMANVLEPLLLLVMGGIVLFVALSIILPIYKLSSSLGR